MAKNFSKVLNLADDFYNGAVKGAKKANFTINKVAKKNNIVKNLDVTKTINGSKKVVKNNGPIRIKQKAPMKRTPIKEVKVEPSAAQKAGNWAGGGTRDSINAYKKMSDNEKSIIGAVKKGHQKIGPDGKTQYDMGKIAGTTFSVGVAGRIATGGGLYRDRYGNTNIPGVPFV